MALLVFPSPPSCPLVCAFTGLYRVPNISNAVSRASPRLTPFLTPRTIGPRTPDLQREVAPILRTPHQYLASKIEPQGVLHHSNPRYPSAPSMHIADIADIAVLVAKQTGQNSARTGRSTENAAAPSQRVCDKGPKTSASYSGEAGRFSWDCYLLLLIVIQHSY